MGRKGLGLNEKLVTLITKVGGGVWDREVYWESDKVVAVSIGC